jgi:hypothetical protein
MNNFIRSLVGCLRWIVALFITITRRPKTQPVIGRPLRNCTSLFGALGLPVPDVRAASPAPLFLTNIQIIRRQHPKST